MAGGGLPLRYYAYRKMIAVKIKMEFVGFFWGVGQITNLGAPESNCDQHGAALVVPSCIAYIFISLWLFIALSISYTREIYVICLLQVQSFICITVL